MFIPASLGAWLIVLMFPLIVAAALVYPVYVIWRFAHLRRHGLTDAFGAASKRFLKAALVGGVLMYGILALAMFWPQVAPVLTNFIGEGGLALIVPVIFLNFLLSAILSESNALRANFRRTQRS